jgi:hypothetical protein
MNPRFPVFIPTKGRWESRLTIKAFETLGVPYKAVIEPQEYEQYASVVNSDNLIVLPHRDKGLVVTRNWIWDYAESLGVERFWTFDDNIANFQRLNRNAKIYMGDGTFLYVIEEFALRYENLPIIGMAYRGFAKQKQKLPPLILNTRVYSNMLIETNSHDPRGKKYRNEGFYNDDTDLCLRVLKDGFCTAQTSAFLASKQPTMTIQGGMTPHYLGDGRWKMAYELQQKHPDVVTITRKWGRWQHQVNYKPFANNKLKLREGVEIPEGVNNYGMVLMRDGVPVEQPTNG